MKYSSSCQENVYYFSHACGGGVLAKFIIINRFTKANKLFDMLCKRSPSVELVTIFRFIMRLEYDMITHPLWECFILYGKWDTPLGTIVSSWPSSKY